MVSWVNQDASLVSFLLLAGLHLRDLTTLITRMNGPSPRQTKISPSGKEAKDAKKKLFSGKETGGNH